VVIAEYEEEEEHWMHEKVNVVYKENDMEEEGGDATVTAWYDNEDMHDMKMHEKEGVHTMVVVVEDVHTMVEEDAHMMMEEEDDTFDENKESKDVYASFDHVIHTNVNDVVVVVVVNDVRKKRRMVVHVVNAVVIV